jgi:DNA-binding XRE family transcriptional regulator
MNVGLTAQQVAQQVGVSESTVRNWDKGRSVPTLAASQFVTLTQIYQCSLADIANAVVNSRKEKDGAND